MGFAINTNNDALSTYRNLTNVQNSLSKSLEKLSSGLRINQAGDDAAGLTISTQLGSQISGLTQASRNAQDGVSVVQTADGALGQAQTILGRLRDLAVQAANDSNSVTARSAITTEATSLTSELTRLSTSVNFNGQRLLDGSAGTAGVLTFQVGADGNAQSQITVNLTSANLATVANSLTNGSSANQTTLTQAAALFSVSNGSGTTFAVPSGLTTSLAAATTVDQQVTLLNSNAAFSSDFRAVKVTTSGTDYVSITANDGSAATAKSTASGNPSTGNSVSGAGVIGFGSASAAQNAITSIDAQLANVSTARANIGALENRFASAVSTISTSIQNLTAAKSRITDVDMASEMINYTRANVLAQSGTAMLAQANSLPQLALKLLQT